MTAQVDGGENRPLGWGPEIGVRLIEEEAGWFARALAAEATAPVQVRYRGENRFVVTEGKHIVDVHQGDPTNVRDEAGKLHQLILRRYGAKPKDPKGRSGPDAGGLPALGERLTVARPRRHRPQRRPPPRPTPMRATRPRRIVPRRRSSCLRPVQFLIDERVAGCAGGGEVHRVEQSARPRRVHCAGTEPGRAPLTAGVLH